VCRRGVGSGAEVSLVLLIRGRLLEEEGGITNLSGDSVVLHARCSVAYKAWRQQKKARSGNSRSEDVYGGLM